MISGRVNTSVGLRLFSAFIAMRPIPAVWAAIAIAAVLSATAATASYQIGDRELPSTPLTGDAFVADAMYGTIDRLSEPDGPDFGSPGLAFGIDKRITETLGVSLAETYDILMPRVAGNRYGFDNLSVSLKYQAVEDVPHETLFLVGVEREFGDTGAQRVGAAPVGLTTPTVYTAKGLGDLPEALRFLRPLAVTGTFGLAGARHSRPWRRSLLRYGGHRVLGAIQPFKYLQGAVENVGLPPLIGRLTPIVEFRHAAPVSASVREPSTGIVAPGFIYSDNGVDIGVETLLPLNRRSGTGIGAIAKLRIPLDRVADALAKPLFGTD